MTKADLAALQEVIAQMVAQAMVKPVTAKGNIKSDRSIKNEALAIRAFKKAGFGTVVPHEDVKSFGRWAALGLRPIEGTKAVKVKNLRLFHKSQVRPMTSEETQKLAEDNAAYAARQQTGTQPQAVA